MALQKRTEGVQVSQPWSNDKHAEICPLEQIGVRHRGLEPTTVNEYFRIELAESAEQTRKHCERRAGPFRSRGAAQDWDSAGESLAMLESDHRLVMAPCGSRQAHQAGLGLEAGRRGEYPTRRISLDKEPLPLARPHHGQSGGERGHAA
jgi:hypothetical protein